MVVLERKLKNVWNQKMNPDFEAKRRIHKANALHEKASSSMKETIICRVRGYLEDKKY
ncbi:hypothetical protein P872_07295 [Rhodonellum psychrophilum GCM71 = DSM 17998]|uniref:Uncharacterized protein n=1 Tax=Rhodonellum psychrophilum GCM71 = DSM 17998 TaxID=1123057 RepID=U5BXB1_9BACT|nr:hypothetical protein P872_07295 [Rhodonellum psychrophilum GCM71 = DSM 17998]